ncbi:MAG TPA: MMPL family transporter [Allocoleopsis sp.]
MSQTEKVTFQLADGTSIFAWLGYLAYRYRWTVIASWGILVLLSLALTPHLDSVLKGAGMAYKAGEAHRVEQVLQQELNASPDALTVVFQSLSNPTLDENQTEIEHVLTQVRRLPSVSSVVSAAERPEYRSADGRTQYSVINLKVSGNETLSAIDRIEQVLAGRDTRSLKTYLTGQPVVERDAQRISKRDLSRAELITLPLTLIALLFVFGSAVAASLPVAMGVMTVAVTLGLLSLVTLKMELSIFALNITTMLGLGIGIDFSLLIVNRFREELRLGSVEQAVVRTVDTAGRTVFFSGLTTGIGLVSLLLFPIVLLRSLGVAGSLVIWLSVAAAVTLVPALLGVLGHGVNRWRVVRPSPQRKGVWKAIAQTIMRHSMTAVAAVLVLVAILASPFLAARFGVGDVNILPRDVPGREGVEVLEQAFGPGETAPILLAVSTKNPTEPILANHHIATLYNLVDKLKADPRVAGVSSLFNIDPKLSLENYQQLYSHPALIPSSKLADAVTRLSSHSMTLITVNSRTPSNDAASRDLVQELRRLSLDNLRIQVGGQTASGLDTLQVVYQRFPWVLAVMMTVTFVTLCILFGSIVLPLKAIFLNFMSIGASFGALVFIFQEGHFQTWLNFTPLGYLDILLPVVLFCVLFGLSMDYEVFLLTRIKEAYDRSHNNSLSVIEGLERTGRIITSAALLMIIVTGAFALTSIIFVKALGLGVAIAIFIDSTLIRAVLVPASMHLMGKWNWWTPKFLRLDRIKFKLND